MIRPHRVDGNDVRCKGHGLVDNEVDELGRGGLASQELEFVVYRARPGEDGAEGDLGWR